MNEIDNYMTVNEEVKEKETVFTVYEIKNNENNKKYIGITRNLKKRLSIHFSKLRNNKHINEKMQADFSKYGEHSFEVKTLFESGHSGISLQKEKDFIRKYDTINNGYNIKGKEATWHKKVTLGASVGEEEGIRILEYFDKMSISRSEWIREAILDKAKSEGII